MTVQLRCEGTLYGVISDDHKTIEVKCKRRKCGYAPGVVILHTLSLESGQVTSTRAFRDPTTGKERHVSPLRPPSG